jgi:hypothetical protein
MEPKIGEPRRELLFPVRRKERQVRKLQPSRFPLTRALIALSVIDARHRPRLPVEARLLELIGHFQRRQSLSAPTCGDRPKVLREHLPLRKYSQGLSVARQKIVIEQKLRIAGSIHSNEYS